MIVYIIAAICCYLLGSIPFSYILVKSIKGVDIRTLGSKNVGATNAGRILGFKGFLVAFLLDMLKGYIPILIFGKIFNFSIELQLLFGIIVILGHTFTIFLNFKGGKGVATAVGVYLAVSPQSLVIALIVFLVVVGIWRMVSLGSITAALTLLVNIVYSETSMVVKVFTAILVFFVIYKHKENIKRIVNGTEKKIGDKVG
ncbi:MAG: glycerol-3-phosphate 1-O-acyltransferase PlsY [Calditerrivibrio sp.]|nr:glycerol-3-phosphate 1-O-acyltransferase PlsY [Calditerrivibrio sp.]MCA1980886.1 glycerol-3-phosphate 1-O-acyltransferase PlsY [Calditerrivibrio sp.]